MNKLITLMVCLLVLVTASVNALTLGSNSADASNLDNDDQETYITGTITNANLTSADTCTFTVSNSKYLNTPDNLQVNNVNVSFTVNNGSVDVRARIPENLDSVSRTTLPNDADEGSAFQVGTIVCSDAGQNTVLSEVLNMQRQNMIKIGKVYARTAEYDASFKEHNDKIDQLLPGMNLDFEIEVENQYSDDDDVDLEDIDVTLDCGDDIDDDDDDTIDVSADEEDSVFLIIELDEDDVEDKTYSCTLSVSGEDEYGAFHGEEWELDLEVEKEKYDLDIRQARLDNDAITCNDREVLATLQLKNTGKNDDDDIRLQLTVPAIGIDVDETEIDLDETDETRQSFRFVVPDDAPSGLTNVIIRGYSKGLSLTEEEVLTLNIPDCGTSSSTNDDTSADDNQNMDCTSQTQSIATTCGDSTITVGALLDRQSATFSCPAACDSGSIQYTCNEGSLQLTQNTCAQTIAIDPTPSNDGSDSDDTTSGNIVIADDEDDNEGEVSEESESNLLYIGLLGFLIFILLGGIVGLLIFLLKPGK